MYKKTSQGDIDIPIKENYLYSSTKDTNYTWLIILLVLLTIAVAIYLCCFK